jgi:uracil-DNA glycosylase family 4
MVSPPAERPELPAAGALERLARGARQRLFLERSFGWVVPLAWPLSLPAPEPPAAAPPPPAAPPRAGDPHAPAAERLPAAPRAAASSEERSRRRELLRPIEEEVRACRACVLCEGRSRTVFGVGDPCARLLFIGEAPGEDEDRQGEPFVGKAGQLLTRMIQAMGMSRGDVYIANIVKCRPPGNRNPVAREIISCLPYLRRQIEVIGPELICTLGNVATRALLDTQESISRLRGRFSDFRGIPVLPTFHPSYLLRNPEDKRLVWDDLRKVMNRLGIKEPERG